MEQEENKWKVKVDESQKTIKQVFKESLVKKISKSCVNYWKKTKSKQTGSSQRGGSGSAASVSHGNLLDMLLGPTHSLLGAKLWGQHRVSKSTTPPPQ